MNSHKTEDISTPLASNDTELGRSSSSDADSMVLVLTIDQALYLR